MKRIIYVFILLFFALRFSGNGQERITLQLCRQLALQKNENLSIAVKQIEKAKAEKAVVKTMRLPNFSASATGIYQEKDFEIEMMLPTQKPNLLNGELEPNIMIDPSSGIPVTGADGNPVFNMYAWLPLNISLNGAYLAGVSLEQPLFTGGKINAGCKMADIGIKMAGENLELQRMNTIVEADNAYWSYIAVSQKVNLARQVVEMLSGLVEKARDSYNVEMTGKKDLLKAQVEYNNARINLQKAKNSLELLRMELCRITGLPIATPVLVVDTVIKIDAPGKLTGEIQAVKSRPEYRLMQDNIDMQEQNIHQIRADFLPEAGIQAGYSHVGGVEFSGTDFSNSSLNLLASLKIPIFHWGEGRRKINAARIEKEIKELELEKNAELMIIEVEQARLNLKLAWERVQISNEALAEAGENMRVSRDNYEVGMETITDLLIAQTHWKEAYSGLIDSKTDFKIRETIWLKVTGRLFSKE